MSNNVWIFVGGNPLRGQFDHIAKQCNLIEVGQSRFQERIWDERTRRVALLSRSGIWEE